MLLVSFNKIKRNYTRLNWNWTTFIKIDYCLLIRLRKTSIFNKISQINVKRFYQFFLNICSNSNSIFIKIEENLLSFSKMRKSHYFLFFYEILRFGQFLKVRYCLWYTAISKSFELEISDWIQMKDFSKCFPSIKYFVWLRSF